MCGTLMIRAVGSSASLCFDFAHRYLIFGLARSIDSMIRRLTKRTELEIVAQWPKEGDIADDEATAYITSLLGDCSPDMENEGKLSSRSPEELMRLLVSYLATSHEFSFLYLCDGVYDNHDRVNTALYSPSEELVLMTRFFPSLALAPMIERYRE